MTYNVDFTDPLKAPIEVEETGLNEDFSVSFPGRIRLEWGKDVNESLLRMLENFASPALDANENVPDEAYSGTILSNPVDGQVWYNTTNERIYKYSETLAVWTPLGNKGQMYAANWGQIQNGAAVPRPVASNGYVFPYDECIVSVSPHNYLDGTKNMLCRVNQTTGVVQMLYITKGTNQSISGIANYMIVGILKNQNQG